MHNYTTNKINVQPERLNLQELRNELSDSPNNVRKAVEMGITRPSATLVVTKVTDRQLHNQDSVLNAAAKRLGVSLNCLEDNKSSLIDLELCIADNRAEGNCHGERLSEKTLVGCDSLNRLVIA